MARVMRRARGRSIAFRFKKGSWPLADKASGHHLRASGCDAYGVRPSDAKDASSSDVQLFHVQRVAVVQCLIVAIA